jgi:hypothetical protein
LIAHQQEDCQVEPFSVPQVVPLQTRAQPQEPVDDQVVHAPAGEGDADHDQRKLPVVLLLNCMHWLHAVLAQDDELKA